MSDPGNPKIYLLPNLMTAGNLFCGFAAILKILEGALIQAASTAPLLVWMSAPPNSCLVNDWPSRATTGGPATNIADDFVITE